ncbi:MAG TPA: anaerobic ribonucleoside-triphosphate reductase [Candidatus Pacearchaeota archaeon]|nr:anaerobic ribonucleoside-triphosphate reductase [Candidatus Pacearchaeota archaeon]HQI74457.1 anaerobic ribonucleoside-triphosphate reductase [Candidatus Pacearchaeota archaeon]
MENAKDAKNDFLFCHDCKKKIKIEGENIIDGAVLVYNDNGEKINIVKCSNCCQKDPALNNFRKCEVYSRVVGYLRPTSQWNEGKQQEFKDRENYKINEC